MVSGKAFWETKSLQEMSLEEWESLCDRCGRCCLHKIEDMDTGEILFTNVVCELFDLEGGKCTRYRIRQRLVADCMNLRKDFPPLHWLPATCAYRLLSEGKSLPRWHPLISGRVSSVQENGISIRSFAVSETDVEDITDHVMEGLH